MGILKHIVSTKRVCDKHKKLNNNLYRFLLVSFFSMALLLANNAQTTIASFNFDNDILTSWTFGATGLNGDANNQNSWEIGIPNGGRGYNDIPGQKGYIGNPDPSTDNTINNNINFVAGQGLGTSSKKEGVSGHFNNSSEWIQSPTLNCADYYNVSLEYYRWANFEAGYDYGFIEVSNDGTNWNIVYSPTTLQDNGWVKQTIDISKYADRKASVYIRWRSESDGSIFYAGWNIDDIRITGKFNSNNYNSSISAGSFVVPTTISSLIDTYQEKISFGEFKITDAGSGDKLPTIIDTLIIKQGSYNQVSNWKKAITNIYLRNTVTGQEISGVVEDDSIFFTNSSFFTIADGSSNTYQLSFYLEPYLIGTKDNQQFEFVLDYGDVICNPAGSFINSGIYKTGASKLQLSIQATKLTFLVEPEQLVSLNRNLLPNIQVAATDANGNVDINYSGTIILSNSGGLSMTGTSKSTSFGIATFSSTQFTQVGGPVTISTTHTGSGSISNATTAVSVTVQNNLSEVVYFENFDNSGTNGWTSGSNYGSSSWEIGSPQGGRGYSDYFGSRGFIGNADPTEDHTADNSINKVYGQGLGRTSNKEGVSAYFNSSEEWLMSPAIDLTNYYNTQLSFWRWANMEPYYDSAFVEISTDGVNWIDLEHTLYPMDSRWTELTFDIATIADRQSTVYFRWRTISDGSIYYAGWNIDDVKITGINSPVTHWTGTSSSDWNNAANWSNGSVPTRITHVYIDASTPNRPIVSSTAECNEIIIKKNAILEISLSGNLMVFGDVQIETDNFNYGALIDRGTINIYGQGKVSRYITGRQWHYISSPINSSNSTQFGEEVYYYDENKASSNWNKGWVLIENTELKLASGYNMYKFKDCIVSLEGKFNSGNYGVSVTNTNGSEIAEHEGWNLIGNPYPSAIDWDAASGWTKTNINNAIYIWDETQQNYVTYISGVGANGGSNYIPPMQGFFVKVTNPGSGYVGMTNDVRIANTQSKLKSAGSDNEGLKISLSKDTYYDETIIRFEEGAGMNFDIQLDAHKKFSGNSAVPQIFTVTSKGEELAINTLPTNNDYSVLPLNITAAIAGTYLLKFDGVWNIDYTKTVYLEDTENDTLINLLTKNSYSFYTESVINSERFILHIGMPLKVKYTVKNESGNNSKDGAIDLNIYGGSQPLTKINWSNGASTEDLNNLSSGTYIVSITDNANNILIDTIVVTKSTNDALDINDTEESDANSINIFSNDKILNVVSSDLTSPVNRVEVYDLSGKQVYSKAESFFGTATIQLNLTAGIYLVRVNQNNTSVTEKILIKSVRL
jgi:hypothetical protein